MEPISPHAWRRGMMGAMRRRASTPLEQPGAVPAGETGGLVQLNGFDHTTKLDNMIYILLAGRHGMCGQETQFLKRV